MHAAYRGAKAEKGQAAAWPRPGVVSASIVNQAPEAIVTYQMCQLWPTDCLHPITALNVSSVWKTLRVFCFGFSVLFGDFLLRQQCHVSALEVQDAWLARLQGCLDQPAMLAQTQAGLNNTHSFLPDLGVSTVPPCHLLSLVSFVFFFSMITKNTVFLLA